MAMISAVFLDTGSPQLSGSVSSLAESDEEYRTDFHVSQSWVQDQILSHTV